MELNGLESDVTILNPEGRIDATALPELSSNINRTINDGCLNLIINFSKCEYMSSAGLRALIEGKK